MFDISEIDIELETSKGLVVLDVWAEWCAPCRPVAAVLNTLEKDYPQIRFLKINVDEAPKISEVYKIYSIPTVLGFKNGELVAQIIGAKDRNKFKEMMDLLMQN